MQVIVGTTPVELPEYGRGLPVIQNLGPGILYLEESNQVTTANGLRIAVGDTYEYPLPATDPIWLVSDTAGTDARVLVVH